MKRGNSDLYTDTETYRMNRPRGRLVGNTCTTDDTNKITLIDYYIYIPTLKYKYPQGAERNTEQLLDLGTRLMSANGTVYGLKSLIFELGVGSLIEVI